MTDEALQRFLDDALGGTVSLTVTPMVGGGSCEVFSIDRGPDRLVLRRSPRHASSSTAHDVLREYRILDAIKDQDVRIARPLLSCSDPAVFGAPFYVMSWIDGLPIRAGVPTAWAGAPASHGAALTELIDALVAIHAVDVAECGLDDLSPSGDFLARQVSRWLRQLESYKGRDLPSALEVAQWLDVERPPDQPATLCHGDYKLDNVLFAPEPPPRLLAVVDWEMAFIGDPLVDVAWALIFHPGPEGSIPLGLSGEPAFALDHLPSRADLIDRYAERSRRDTSAIGWYDVFSRWKLAVVLEGSYAKFMHGRSDNPVHRHFGAQVDRLLHSAMSLVDGGVSR